MAGVLSMGMDVVLSEEMAGVLSEGMAVVLSKEMAGVECLPGTELFPHEQCTARFTFECITCVLQNIS